MENTTNSKNNIVIKDFEALIAQKYHEMLKGKRKETIRKKIALTLYQILFLYTLETKIPLNESEFIKNSIKFYKDDMPTKDEILEINSKYPLSKEKASKKTVIYDIDTFEKINVIAEKTGLKHDEIIRYFFTKFINENMAFDFGKDSFIKIKIC